MLEEDIGTVETGKRADLVLVKGEPLDDIALVADPANVVAVLRGGTVVKDSEERLA
jgi:imidazolonepropionase-like amidohydrolase